MFTESLLALRLDFSEGVKVEVSEVYVERCKCMLLHMRRVCPQMETDGLCNIWIIKPGAKSRGRGIFYSALLCVSVISGCSLMG